MKIILVEPQKYPEVIDIENSLNNFQQLVGGNIEAVYPFNDNIVLVCNAEGKFLNLEPNRQIYHDVIAGTFFLCGIGEEDFTDIPEEKISHYIKKFSNNITPEIELETKIKFEM